MSSINDPTALRIIDANLNRAREALRVMEEYARFALDDRSLTQALKDARHGLAEVVGKLEHPPLDPPLGRGEASGTLLRARDIVGDVGREVSTAAEYQRAGAADVALAAAKRLGEALRAIEEYGKTIDPAFAAEIEKLRYRGYELERRLTITIDAVGRFGHARLYVLLTEALCHGDWYETAEACLRGGADCLQLREKDLSDRELLDRAQRLADLCHDHDAVFIVNDRPDVAAISGADGVHLGQDDMPVSAARRVIPPHGLVGKSTHTSEQIEAAIEEVPDYLAVGPMFATPTKPQDHIAGPETLAAARRQTALPLVAIGGITDSNAADVLSSAPCCVCVCQAVIAQPDPEASAARLKSMIDEASAD
ncbi:MAG: thiamine phosphate synthase [Phycisphaerae bacterium]|jgi:thiamine-phosphate pyrophosphorylase